MDELPSFRGRGSDPTGGMTQQEAMQRYQKITEGVAKSQFLKDAKMAIISQMEVAVQKYGSEGIRIPRGLDNPFWKTEDAKALIDAEKVKAENAGRKS